MATGDTNDMAGRLAAVLPARWFPPLAQAPALNAILQGLGAGWSYCYTLLSFVRLQARLTTSSGVFVDMRADDLFGSGNFPRLSGETDTAYIARIQANLFVTRGTRPSLVSVLTTDTGAAPIILEPMNPSDTGGWGTLANSAIGGGGGFDQAGIAWGSLKLPGQFFVTTTAGSMTPAQVYADISTDLPAGVTAWTDVTSASGA